MKSLYFMAAALFCSTVSAQSQISFESSEGYVLGDINGQNGWTVTETSDGPLTNQTISNEVASTGIYSFKNAYVPEYDAQWFPIFGIEKSFTPALDYKNTTVSYDFYAPQQGGADFEFAVYSINDATQEYDILLSVGFENRGLIYIFNEKNFGGFTYADAQWSANQWYNLKVEIKKNTITYYLNDAVIYSGENTSKVNVNGINFLHNNYGGSAFYDNIKVNGERLAVNTVSKATVAVYPNPVKNNLNFSLPNTTKTANIAVYNLVGQKILNKETTENTINLAGLRAGTYIITITGSNGISYSSKFIKE
ncbi:T9SS type A sorting domain-containing protein [Kaistella palustris]|uniref:T9SS type A sorting domain-containing protein n=1 Tax=Kaistella palustris TaxID=493376 RepID=UPI0012EB7216|nr:T9SS type A sorting domain-containing protein [Kaistella palustris]